MALQYLISPIIQLEDTNGQTLVNGKIYVYHHDTDQLAVIYKDFDGGFQTNPAILDELGTVIIIADNTVAFDIEVYDKDDNFVLSRKNIYATGGGSGRADISYDAGVDIQFRQPTQNNTIIDVVNNDCTNTNFGFAIGHNTTADYYGVAMGENTSAYGKGSVTIGYGNDVTGANQVAIGRNNKLYSDTQLGSNSLVVGDSNSALSLNKSIVYGTTNYITGTTDGIYGGTDNSANGSTDFIIGGISNKAENTDKGGIIGGASNSAFRTNSIIIGGQQNIADNGGMSINGLENTVTNEYAVAFGEGNTVPNSFAVAFGKYNVVPADYAFVQGYNNTAANEYSHAEGVNTVANGPGSHSEGNGTTALGNWSHAEGDHSIATGWHSHAEGSNTTAVGSNSHTIGANTIAYGTNSFAGGFNTVASGSDQTVFGRYNIPNETDLFQIGAGTPGNNNKNALTISNNGDVNVNTTTGLKNTRVFFDNVGDVRYYNTRGIPIMACTGTDFEIISTTGATGMFAACLSPFTLPNAKKVKVDGFYQIKGGMNANGSVPNFQDDPKIETWIIDRANSSAIEINAASLTNGSNLPRSVPIPFSFVTGGTTGFEIGFGTEGTWTATNMDVGRGSTAGNLVISYTTTILDQE